MNIYVVVSFRGVTCLHEVSCFIGAKLKPTSIQSVVMIQTLSLPNFCMITTQYSLYS